MKEKSDLREKVALVIKRIQALVGLSFRRAKSTRANNTCEGRAKNDADAENFIGKVRVHSVEEKTTRNKGCSFDGKRHVDSL